MDFLALRAAPTLAILGELAIFRDVNFGPRNCNVTRGFGDWRVFFERR